MRIKRIVKKVDEVLVQYSHEVWRASDGPHQCIVFESLEGLLLK